METRLTADVARELSYIKQDSFEKTLQTIRMMVDSQIRDAAKMGRTKVDVEVPRSVFGRPPYDLAEMGKRLAQQMYADGFAISGTYSRLCLSWNREEKKKPAKNGGGNVINVPVPKSSAVK